MASDEYKGMNTWVYDLVLWVLTVIIDLFFREIHPRSSWKIPKSGPVIFVAAPHANQVCLRAFSSTKVQSDTWHSL